MLLPRHYENLHILHENTLPNRAYYIPASVRLDDPVENREASDRLQLLGGDWLFRYYPSVEDLDDPFWEETFDTDDFTILPVPSVWQNHGYDTHQYIDGQYPFPMDPPYLPYDNPCGAYRRTFDYHPCAQAPLVHLSFEGVDSCLYVWLNGQYIGYSQVSHSTSEFDLTPHIREGNNTLAVLVVKWCDGSYFEDQDKFRMSGIFRDVYLLQRTVDGITDYTVHGAPDGTVTVTMERRGQPVPVTLTLYDRENHPVAHTVTTGNTAVLSVPAPRLWSAEDPYLYTLTMDAGDEYITEQVGLRDIRVAQKPYSPAPPTRRLSAPTTV